MNGGTASIYTAGWLVFVLATFVLAARRRRELSLLTPGYVAFLTERWKLVIFGVALAGFVLMAPYTGDATWDWFDAAFMSILTFVTSPWAVGTLVRIARGQVARWQLLPIAALWLLSASWLYDVYIWSRDGIYPSTWWSNLIASSVLYLCAGLLWNLTPSAKGRPTFAFLESGWPTPSKRGLGLQLWLCVAGFALFVVAMMSPFLLELWDRAF